MAHHWRRDDKRVHKRTILSGWADASGWAKATTFEEIHKFNLEWLEQCQRLLKPNGTIWVTGTTHNIYSVGFALQTLGYKILNDIAGYKVSHRRTFRVATSHTR